uniref:Light-independent protochlorophyllide reductase subunit B n=1 Tax=Bracteacoccus giganteus TaxID=50039 RepID=A0A0S2LQF9_9CHLO|nr:ChlB subunit of protochlorophyllide reductase [Bracteacoccus giganteus]ALO63494.1 ChlB subunit of protochlorophyllide reductase [Bracteacoccus giganteus]
MWKLFSLNYGFISKNIMDQLNMKLAYWMYAGPAHIGTLRVASSFKNVHAIMHAPLGDDYFNVMRSMLERERDFTPVTASIVDRHVLARGSQEKVVENITRKDKEECPDLILLTPTCTSSILQEDLQNFVERASLESESDVILADVNHYRVNELQAADRTLEQIVRFYLEKAKKQNTPPSDEVMAKMGNSASFKPIEKTEKPSANILGIFTLGFHNQHDCRELKRLLNDLGIEINEIVPEGGTVSSLKNLPKAWFNIVAYREVGLMTAVYLEKEFGMPYVSTTPMGIVDTANFIREIETILKIACAMKKNSLRDDDTSMLTSSTHSADAASVQAEHTHFFDFENYIDQQTRFISQAAWFSRSIDCQNLTGKRVVVFGDATHAASMTKILSREMGIRVACAGTYCKHDADWFREQVFGFCDQVLITEDHTQVGDMIAQLEPAAIFGTQMERHVGKRLDIPCGVISAPVHIQNFPLGYRPFLGYEGTNQIADLVYNSFSLGMEDHLLEIFGGHDTKEVITKSLSTDSEFTWATDGLTELNKIPGFVRGKVKRNTEKFARQNNIQTITVEVMFAAKEAAGA